MGGQINLLLLFGIMLLNSGISLLNANACGAYLTESHAMGGWARLSVWSGLVMSTCGSTWVYLVIFNMVAVTMKYITPAQGKILFNLGYFMILVPVLGLGFSILTMSLVRAYRIRKFGNVAVTGWSTGDKFHNTYSAARHAPDTLRKVIDFLSGGGKSNSTSSSKNNRGVVILLLVIPSLASGLIITAVIARWADKRVDLQVNPDSSLI